MAAVVRPKPITQIERAHRSWGRFWTRPTNLTRPSAARTRTARLLTHVTPSRKIGGDNADVRLPRQLLLVPSQEASCCPALYCRDYPCKVPKMSDFPQFHKKSVLAPFRPLRNEWLFSGPFQFWHKLWHKRCITNCG